MGKQKFGCPFFEKGCIEMKKESIKKINFIILLFIIGSFIGFLHENILNLIIGRYILRKGLIYEPLIPIYGLGLVILYLSYNSIDFKNKSKWKELLTVFIFGFFLGGFTEYMGSLIQEKVFGTISWDYSNIFLNIYGRTSVFHAAFWGLAGLIFYEALLPWINKLKSHMEKRSVNNLAMVLSTVFILDCLVSFSACYRVTERRNNIAANNTFDRILDKYYPDEYIEKIYNNARVPKDN